MLRRQLGRFRLAVEATIRDPGPAMRLMGHVIVLRAEHMLASDEIEYMAISPSFRGVEVGEVIPCYQVVYASDGELAFVEVTIEPGTFARGMLGALNPAPIADPCPGPAPWRPSAVHDPNRGGG